MKNYFTNYLYVFLLIFLISYLTPIFSEPIAPAEIFLKRHSYRAYDPTQPVSKEQISAMIEAARWAPSSYNEQPWNFIFCDKYSNPEAYMKALDSVYESQQQWVQNAPLLVVVVTRTKTSHKNKPNEWADYDTGAAAVSMALQASEMGLMAHQIGGFDKEKIRESFQLPEHHQPSAIMVVGVEPTEGDPGAKPRHRKPVQENFFWGEWGTGISY